MENVATWLERYAIGFGANPKEMQVYATELYELGIHSVQMILQFCQPDADIEVVTDSNITAKGVRHGRQGGRNSDIWGQAAQACCLSLWHLVGKVDACSC